MAEMSLTKETDTPYERKPYSFGQKPMLLSELKTQSSHSIKENRAFAVGMPSCRSFPTPQHNTGVGAYPPSSLCLASEMGPAPNWPVYLRENPHMLNALKYGDIDFFYKGTDLGFDGALKIFNQIQKQKQRECAGANVAMPLTILRESVKKSLFHLAQKADGILMQKHRLMRRGCGQGSYEPSRQEAGCTRLRKKLYSLIKAFVKLTELYHYSFPLGQNASQNDASFYQFLCSFEEDLARRPIDLLWWRLFNHPPSSRR